MKSGFIADFREQSHAVYDNGCLSRKGEFENRVFEQGKVLPLLHYDLLLEIEHAQYVFAISSVDIVPLSRSMSRIFPRNGRPRTVISSFSLHEKHAR